MGWTLPVGQCAGAATCWNVWLGQLQSEWLHFSLFLVLVRAYPGDPGDQGGEVKVKEVQEHQEARKDNAKCSGCFY